MLQKSNHKSLKKITSSGVMTVAGIAAVVLFGIATQFIKYMQENFTLYPG
jgi:hypothetical protein